MDKAENSVQITSEMKQIAEIRARARSSAAKWDIDVAAFFFATSMLVLILVFQGVAVQIVSASAVAGLSMGWLIGQRKGLQQYKLFYEEELLKLERE